MSDVNATDVKSPKLGEVDARDLAEIVRRQDLLKDAIIPLMDGENGLPVVILTLSPGGGTDMFHNIPDRPALIGLIFNAMNNIFAEEAGEANAPSMRN